MPYWITPEVVTGSISRRDLLGLGAGAAAVLALSGCAGGTGTGDAPAGPTRTVEGAFGPVEIPVDPRRVAATDFYTTYALLDVGFTVVATAQATVGGVLPSLQAAYDAIPKIGTPQQPSYEAILAQRPDLILGTLVPNLPADLPGRLGAVAPTLLFPAGSSPGTWQERAVKAADAVGRRGEAEALRTRYEQRAREVGDRHRDRLAGIRIGLVRGGPQGVALVDLPQSWAGVVLTAIGARLPAFAEGRPGASARVSYEELAVLADCEILLHLADTRGGVDPTTATMLDSPAFRALPAVRAGDLHPLPNYYVSHYGQGLAVLDELDRILGG
ncbi:ABC transporter substrate-binding protein [Pseudonocardia tropica]|uniref:ABC transporter substrate-binding protein n=1 Tax=Pseudonocardia tropica TaxID=681289 RepID=A0ABV1JVF7_9PSEU